MKGKIWLLGALGLGLALGCTGCGEDEPGPATDFNFTVKLQSGNSSYALELNSTDKIVITETNPPKDPVHYTFTLADNAGEYISVDPDGTIHANKVTPDGVRARVSIKAENTNVRAKSMSFTVYDTVTPAKGGKNWASSTEDREKILGELENYAMRNFLTGIALFENAGYTRFSSRINPGTTQYITGYGLGVLGEGDLDKTQTLNSEDEYPSYYHTGTGSDPETVNGFDAQGSDVSDLFSYISSSFWGTKMNSKKDGYVWYPVLARDSIDGGTSEYSRPIPQENVNPLKMYRKWRIYVKTGDANEGAIAYRYSGKLKDGEGHSFDGRKVELADYETTLMALLTQKSNVFRGAELAGDTTYGIRGALTYYNRTNNKVATADCIKTWNDMKEKGELGIATGKDTIGSYIDIELLNPIDAFTAMYTLSSNLYTPLPLDFLSAVGDGDFTSGLKNFGTFKGKEADDAILDHTISVGPYFLEHWHKNAEMVFGRNDNWYEVDKEGHRTGRYKIEGVHMRYYKDAASDPEHLYKQFQAGMIDVTGIPSTKMGERLPTDIASKGDSTFKLNVNSCDQKRWNELFGTNGTINNPGVAKRDNAYKVKPWMSNMNFLNGLYWSINRKDFAESQGVTPSFNYFADSYMSDPEKGISYNSTQTHKDAVAEFHNVKTDSQGQIIEDDYGYNLGAAKTYFKQAVNELLASGDIQKGTKTNPYVMKISIEWMYQSDIKQYGDKIVKYFTDAFNDPDVSGETVKLEIEQGAVTKWDDVYNKYLMIGEYDLAFGAISGNSYNPLNFLEVLKSDNSSGFTLNWGADTSKIDERNPIIYDNQSWSFDALWAAADHGTITEDGRAKNAVKHNYLKNPKSLSGSETNNIYLGAKFEIVFEFVDVPGVELDITEVHIYLVGVGSLVIDSFTKVKNDDGTYTISFTLDAATAGSYDKQIYDNNQLDKKVDDNPDLAHPFKYDTYNEWWDIEVYYNLALLGGATSQIIDASCKNATEDASQRK